MKRLPCSKRKIFFIQIFAAFWNQFCSLFSLIKIYDILTASRATQIISWNTFFVCLCLCIIWQKNQNISPLPCISLVFGFFGPFIFSWNVTIIFFSELGKSQDKRWQRKNKTKLFFFFARWSVLKIHYVKPRGKYE